MCGIAGIVHKNKGTIDPSLLLSMAKVLSHRGPDDERFSVFNSRNETYHSFKRGEAAAVRGDIGFAHRRLSIIDLSEAGSQPMADKDNSVWIIYNGEIFNYLELKKELKDRGHLFQTQSDTEVIINAYREWDQDCLKRFNGMWAFVLYDRKKNVLFGARDRFGIKPLHYHISPDHFSFASEIKGLLRLPWVSVEPSLPAIKDYLVYSRTNTSEHTFFEGISRLPAGHSFTISLEHGFHLQLKKWWDLPESALAVPEETADIAQKFRALLLSSVRLRLRSDVPIGTCLSGGIDSSAVVCLANPFLKEGNQKSFSMISPGFVHDESAYIDQIGKEFNIISYKTSLNGTDFLAEMDQLIQAHDEPFTSTSMYAQWKVFQLAKQNGVTVTLDGQGADELLAGYPYFKLVYWAELLQKRKFLRCINEVKSDSRSKAEIVRNLLMSLSGFLSHRKMISLAGFKDPQYKRDWLNKKYFRGIPLAYPPRRKKFSSRLNQRLYEVFNHDGLPALLRYADRNSMGHSVEARMPFLDHRLVSYVFSLSPDTKIHKGLSKDILRKALKKDIPSNILARRDKIGFDTPEEIWFREEMSRWLAEIIDSRSMNNRGFYNIPELKHLFERHRKGEVNASRPVWRAVNLELWQRKYLD